MRRKKRSPESNTSHFYNESNEEFPEYFSNYKVRRWSSLSTIKLKIESWYISND